MKREPLKKLSPYELVEIYKPTHTLIKELLSIEYEKLDRIKEQEKKIIDSCDKHKIPYREKENLKWILLIVYIEYPRKEVENKIEHYKRLISIIKYTKTNKEDIKLNIDKAKSGQISDFLEFNRANKTLCIWHNEKTPSLHYYKNKNRVHCFSCGKNADVIDVVQKLFDVDFVAAVKLILKR